MSYEFFSSINNIFDDFFYKLNQNYITVNVMRSDITETENQYLLNMELLGF